MRRIAEASLSLNPLPTEIHPPEISVAIPVAAKDCSNIDLVISNILENSANPISDIFIVHEGEAPKILNSTKVRITTLKESEFVPPDLEKIIKTFDSNRQGWVRQQVIKFLAVTNSPTDSTLLCDSDTYLTGERLWVTADGRQQLQISHEYTEEYERHFESMFGVETKPKCKVSFVTHHQLMQKSIVVEMFGENLIGLTKWLELADKSSSSPVSEYHCYGRFLSTRQPEKCSFSRWNNLFVLSQNEKLEELIKTNHDRYSSISVHRY